ncbi:efflux RND transporter periplasmic adaptor subunit [Myxococcus sp. K15C18031901]|uniref:efflux RND transporter periplasmic adaptor subunit n=1 Tax=Myxococcus dinghuensis TaxID=2906761 RepID=UPI0020A789B0|nr:efflux RND transporter periplasmic adaptor subunit [Myxococcus dinghuensis]MCP3103477.1 efflux RND transporter periplasmic adaptor subunit [Myxococcus dinghuensis]
MTRTLLMGLLALSAAGCTSAAAPSPTPERTAASPQKDGVIQLAEASQAFVAVTPVQPDPSGALLQAPARVAFRDEAVSRLAAPLAGRVVTVHVRTGDTVKQGDALVTLDCPEAAAARTAVATSGAALREAQSAFERERRMFDQGVSTERERLAAETRLTEAQAELARAQASVGFVGAGGGTTVVLRAPLAGTVLSRSAAVGSAVQPGGEPLVEVGDPSALWVVAEVFERDLPQVREGARVKVTLPSVHAPLEGTVTSVGAVVTTGSRTAPVRVALAETPAGLRPGMFGRVRIDAAEASLTLPVEAVLLRNGKESVVYVKQDERTFVRRSVVIAPPVDGRVQVIAGLTQGEQVVTKGALLLDGAADQLL